MSLDKELLRIVGEIVDFVDKRDNDSSTTTIGELEEMYKSIFNDLRKVIFDVYTNSWLTGYLSDEDYYRASSYGFESDFIVGEYFEFLVINNCNSNG